MNKKNLIKSFIITFIGSLAVVLFILGLVFFQETFKLYSVLFVAFIMAWFLIYKYLE